MPSSALYSIDLGLGVNDSHKLNCAWPLMSRASAGVECLGYTEVTPQMLGEALHLARERFEYIINRVSVK